MKSKQAIELINNFCSRWGELRTTVKYQFNINTNFCEYLNSIEALMNPKSKHWASAEGYDLTAIWAANFGMAGPLIDLYTLEDLGFEVNAKQKEEIQSRSDA